MMTEAKPRQRTVKLTEQEAIYAINSLFAGWHFMELLDKIQDTTLYRQGLKQKMNLAMPEIEKFVDAIGFFFGIDSSAMNTLMEHKRELALKLTAVRPEYCAGLNEILAMFFNNSQEVLDKLDIKLI